MENLQEQPQVDICGLQGCVLVSVDHFIILFTHSLLCTITFSMNLFIAYIESVIACFINIRNFALIIAITMKNTKVQILSAI